MSEIDHQQSIAPIAPPRNVSTEIRPGYLSATFGCQHPECGMVAATVESVARGTPHPDDQFMNRELLEGAVFGGGRQIILKGFLPDLNYSMPLSPPLYEQIAAALRACDLATLYALSKDYTPFYCERCPGVFCAAHYHLVEVWDEAGPDFWEGDCPYGHGKFIDH